MSAVLGDPLVTGTEPGRLRHILGHYPTGVVAITALDAAGGPVGMAVGSFGSVSLSPALVSFMVDRTSTTWPHVRRAGAFCANVLTGTQDEICRALARRGGDKFSDLTWQPSPHSGSPVLDGVAAWIDCRIAQVHEAGDHDIVIGEILSIELATHAQRADPLVFFRGGYSRLTPAAPGQPA